MAQYIENVLLIVVDALRTDRVGAYNGDQLTPNIDSLAKEGEVFEQCYACINATDSSISTILTGLYPTHHGVLNHGQNITKKERERISSTTPLPELLADTHRTLGIDTLERWHERGFETYANPRREQHNPFINYLSDIIDKLPDDLEDKIREIYRGTTSGDTQQTQSELITNLAVESIGTDNPPFFQFLHYWDAHIPYISPKNHPEFISRRSYGSSKKSLKEVLEPIEGSPWSERLNDGLAGDSATVSDMKRKYDAGVWKVDQSIGRVIDELKREGIYEETAVIITSDHGESFTEHGIVFDHHGLYNPTIHVPLIIRAPGFEGRENQFVQHFDVAPTILDLLDKNYRGGQFDGVSLAKKDGTRTLDRDAIFAEEGHTARKRAIQTQSHKYIKRLDDRSKCRYCNISHAPDKELYNLENDPDEKQNIAAENHELVDKLDDRLESWIDNLSNPSKEEISFEASEEVKDHLEEMGYL